MSIDLGLNLEERQLISDQIIKMAHDIRSPLTVLLSVIGAPGDFDEKRRNLAIKATQRVHEIAEHALTGYKKKKVTSQALVNLTSLVTQVIEEKCELIPKDLQLQFKSENGQCLMIGAERAIDLQRIISNLIDNSIDALKAKMKPKIAIKILKLNRNRVEITIEDNGVGMTKEYIKKIGRKGDTTKPSGNGLGLYYAMQTLRKWNGKLKLSSKIGVGTKVSLRLDANQG